MDAILLLEDGTAYEGASLGASGPVMGEVVFNTSMTGYQEILTDPSYCGQIVVMTAPQIGNTGINPRDMESSRCFAAGFVMREVSPTVSSWRAEGDLDSFLASSGVPAISEIDTRALTHRLRERGSMMGMIAPVDADRTALLRQLKAAPSMVGRDLVPDVTCPSPYLWPEGGAQALREGDAALFVRERYPIVAVDLGIKRSILRNLVDVGLDTRVVPATTSADDILAMKPAGVFLANGPGDPAAVTYVIETVKQLLGKVPVFGICLGHQILALALGAKTFKLKFGHHGGNHPVMDLATREVEITAHNHGFAVSADGLPEGVSITHLNLNDRTVEGFACPDQWAFGIQYHPEAGPGPRDAVPHFARFRDMIERYAAGGGDAPSR